MVFSFIHPATCGFTRGIAWEISKEIDEEWKFGDSDTRSKAKQQPCQITVRFNRFNAVFECCKENFAIDLKGFRKILPDLRKKFSGWDRRKIHERNHTRQLSTSRAGRLYPWHSKGSIRLQIVKHVHVVMSLFKLYFLSNHYGSRVSPVRESLR
jgi:hypothetical protein